MIFTVITFIAAFLIEGLGTYVSVIGLSTLFGANPVIIALAVALDLGKLVVVSLLYTYWKQLSKLMKMYALVAATITMIITSAGAAGYLSGEFQKAIIGTQEIGLKVEVLKTEQAKLEERKKQIDNSIAAIPDRYTASQKIRLINQFKEEQKQVTTRLMEISKQLPDMQIQQIGVEAKAGPILYVAKAFDVPVEQAVKWVILMIIFVFDPLAVFLIIAGNFLLNQRRINASVAFDKTSAPKRMTDQEFEASPEKIEQATEYRDDDLGEPDFNAAPEQRDPIVDWVENSKAHSRGDERPPKPEVVKHTQPILEVLQSTPVSPSPQPEAHESEELEQITLDRLRGKAAELESDPEPLHYSVLNDVKADDSLVFEDNPRSTVSRMQYTNYANR